MSSAFSDSPSGRGVCGAEDCAEEPAGLGYDAAISNNAAVSVNGGVENSMLLARLGAAGTCDGICGGGGGDRIGTNVRK
jgi:hypothetical protein